MSNPLRVIELILHPGKPIKLQNKLKSPKTPQSPLVLPDRALSACCAYPLYRGRPDEWLGTQRTDQRTYKVVKIIKEYLTFVEELLKLVKSKYLVPEAVVNESPHRHAVHQSVIQHGVVSGTRMFRNNLKQSTVFIF